VKEWILGCLSFKNVSGSVDSPALRREGQVYESRLHWQKKIPISCRSKNKSRQFFIRKTGELAKNDHVKSSPERQVKAPYFPPAFFSLLLVFSPECYELTMSTLLFSSYMVDEHQSHAEAIAIRKDWIVVVGSNGK
jgi:hypothetical protein